MTGHRARWTTAAALAAAAALGTAGCSGSSTPSGTASKAASAASSLASQANGVLASATAEAGRRLDEIKGGVDARSAVRLGAPQTASDGRTTVPVTATNTTDSTKSFAVQVNFKDSGGNLLDTVVVTVGDVPAGKSAEATARSTHKLSGQVKPEVGTALRY
ncbi:FxLYD domain-containing protein [Streptomyces tropicalis]|uniref:FxLYD domain-containing protein n=1 Tax=Streptomyces tropicalis TaxID=3034234 RepID=A0ABT6AE98_9ACTN|nr:FxLYD domain-containing protein [Streptomyces tropicalis]MDF3302981.1 FxLYD domain-containing protein [Streptomyces tropicalis]